MRRTALLLPLLLFATAPVVVSQQPLSLADLVTATLDQSISLRQSQLRQQQSEIARDTVFSAVVPGITLSADPLYGFDSRRTPDPAAVPPTNVDTRSNSTGLGLSARQLLPTGGVLAGSAGATLSATVTDPDGAAETTYSLSPSVSLSLSQPLFVDGSLIDVDQFFLNRDSATLSVVSAATGTATVREQVALSVVRLVAQRNSLRRAVTAQQTQQRLVQIRLDEAEIREEQGQGSRQDIVTLQVQLNQLQDAELQSRLAARELELELSRLTGLAVSADTRLIVPEGTAVSQQTPGDGAEAGLPLSIEQAQAEVRSAEISYELARKQAAATADFFLSLTPRYADERENADSLSGAFSDFSGDGSGVDVRLGLNLEIPLTEGASRRRTAEQAAIGLELARESLVQAQRELAASRELIGLRVSTLQQRIDLLEFDVAFEREQLESDRQLLELGSVTPFQVAQREASIESTEMDLQNLQAELYLQLLEAHRLGGGDIVSFVTEGDAGVE